MYQDNRTSSEHYGSHQAHVVENMAKTVGQLAGMPATTREISHFERAIVALSHNMEQLEADIQALAGAINPILLPPIPPPSGSESGHPNVAMSNIAESLFKLNHQLECCRNWLQELRSRVDL